MTKHLRLSLVMLLLAVFNVSAWGSDYVKVTSTSDVTDGDYLIVYETGNVAFNGGLQTLDAENNTVPVTITNNTITGSESIDAAVFTYNSTDQTLKSASGFYIGRTANSNGFNSSTEQKYTNTITIDNSGNAVITASGNCTMRFNKASDQNRFRYYKSGQQAIQLYKKVESDKQDATIDFFNGDKKLEGTLQLIYPAHQTITYQCSVENAEVTVTNSNPHVVSCSTSGNSISLTAIGAGTADITATFEGDDNYKAATATLQVTVVDNRTDLEISFDQEQYDMNVGDTEGLTLISSPQLTDDETPLISYESSAEGVATVTPAGEVTAIGEGTATITAFFEGNDNYKSVSTTCTINVIDPNKKGTLNNPYSVSEALEVQTATGVYVQGFIAKIDEVSLDHHNATYWISDDGTTTSQIEIYRGKYLNNANFTSEDQIQLDDEVVVYGNLKLYNNIVEFDQGNYIVSLNRKEKEDVTLEFVDGTETVSETSMGVLAIKTVNVECSVDDATITAVSSDEDVVKATVLSGGTIQLQSYKEGTAVITASFAGNDDYKDATAELTVNVIDNRQEVILTFPETPETIDINETASYVATLNPELPNAIVNYESSNGDVIEAEADGSITAVGVGTATITATYNGDTNYKPATASYTITVVNPFVEEETATLTNENIVSAGNGQSGYTDWTITDDNGKEWKAYAIKNQHSNATSAYHFLQIKKGDNTTSYYIEVPEYGSRIVKLEMTVSGSSQSMTSGSNSAKLFFSNSKTTSAEGEGVASGSGSSSITIDCSDLNMNTGYITAGGAIRIWDVKVTYESPKLSDITFDDAAHESETPNADIVAAHDGEMVNATVNRSFAADKWNTVYLPFALSAEQVKGIFGEGTVVAGYDSFDEAGGDFKFKSVEAMDANVPYLMKPVNAVNGFTAEGVTLVKGEGDVTADLLVPTTSGFHGLLDNHTFIGAINVYYLSTSGKIRQLANEGSLKAMRAFFSVLPEEGDAGDAAAKTFSIDGEVTGIVTVENGVQKFAEGDMFNLAGQRVNNSYKGVVIVNGKKVIKK